MADMIMDSFPEFTGGVVTTGLAARASRSTSPKGWNSVLTNIGYQSATPAKRPGCKTVNTTTFGASNGVSCQIEYLTYASGVPTRRHVVVLGNGDIGYVSTDPVSGTGAYTAISSGTFSSSQGKNLGYTTGKNLLFMADGTGIAKIRGTTLESVGITRPAAAPGIAVGAAGGMTGTYEVRYTYVNGNTNHESSASDTSGVVTVAAQKITVSVVNSGDGQVTKKNIYIRNTATQVAFRLAQSINDNTTTVATLDLDTSLLTILAPNTTQNDPPPSTITSVAWWQSYLIASDDQNIYWSRLNKPEAFYANDFEPVGGLDGQKITGLYPFGPVLLIFKERSVYVLSGRTPASWQLKPMFTDIGCLSQRSIVNAGGALHWWSHRGPVRWEGSGYPEPIGELAFGTVNFEASNAKLIQGTQDETNAMVLWTYPESGDASNTRILPWNYKLNAFTSNRWDPMDVVSIASMQDSGGKRWVYFGNNNGQMFRFDDANADGVPSGTVTGSFTAVGTSVSSITSTGFYTTGTALTSRIAVIEDANRQYVGRARISSNTSTVLTLATSITGLVVGGVYTFHVGGPNFEWATPLEDSGKQFFQKRYKTIHLKTGNGGGLVSADVYTDNDADTPQTYRSFTDDDGEKTTISRRLDVGTVGLEWQAIVHNRAANVPLTLYSVAMLGEVLTDKIG